MARVRASGMLSPGRGHRRYSDYDHDPAAAARQAAGGALAFKLSEHGNSESGRSGPVPIP